MGQILESLPAALGLFVAASAAGFLGLYKSFMVARHTDDDAIESLERLLKIKDKEINTYLKQIETYKHQLDYKSETKIIKVLNKND